MSTNYPGGLDDFVNPTPSDPQDSPSHSGQHTNINDAVEAIEGELGLNPRGSKATVRARLDDIDDWQPLTNLVLAGTTGTDPTLGTGSTLEGWYRDLGNGSEVWREFEIELVLGTGFDGSSSGALLFEADQIVLPASLNTVLVGQLVIYQPALELYWLMPVIFNGRDYDAIQARRVLSTDPMLIGSGWYYDDPTVLEATDEITLSGRYRIS